MVKLITRQKETPKSSDSQKKESRVPISQMGLEEVVELENKYTMMIDNNIQGIYKVLGVIKTQVTPEILEAIIYGCVIQNEEIIILKKDVEPPKEAEFGFNAFRGLQSIEGLCEIGVGVHKDELVGKKVFIPFSDFKLNVHFDKIGERAYWALHSSQKREKCIERINELQAPEDDGTKSSLEDFLQSSSCSDQDEQDLKTVKGGKKKRK